MPKALSIYRHANYKLNEEEKAKLEEDRHNKHLDLDPSRAIHAHGLSFYKELIEGDIG